MSANNNSLDSKQLFVKLSANRRLEVIYDTLQEILSILQEDLGNSDSDDDGMEEEEEDLEKEKPSKKKKLCETQEIWNQETQEMD